MIAYLKNCIHIKHLLWNKLALTTQCPNVVILPLRETKLFFGWQKEVEEPNENWTLFNHKIGSYCVWWEMRVEKKPNQKQMTSHSFPVKHRQKVYGFHSLSNFLVYLVKFISLTHYVMKRIQQSCVLTTYFFYQNVLNMYYPFFVTCFQQICNFCDFKIHFSTRASF